MHTYMQKVTDLRKNIGAQADHCSTVDQSKIRFKKTKSHIRLEHSEKAGIESGQTSYMDQACCIFCKELFLLVKELFLLVKELFFVVIAPQRAFGGKGARGIDT